MTYTIKDREAGNEIDTFSTLDEAKAELERYEAEDKKEGTYTEDFYEIAVLDDIKHARLASGMTQQMMSDILGIPKRTIGNWETGASSPVDWAEPMILHTISRLAEVMHTHKYVAVDDAGADVWNEFFDSRDEANESAEDAWNKLTSEEQKNRHVYVTDIFGSDLDPDAFKDFVEDDEVDWDAYIQSGHDTDHCFDSDK